MTVLPELPVLDWSKTTLGNGLDVIVRRQGPLPVAAANLWYHVGSKDESPRLRGFAHLFEHLMFEGSQHYPGDFFKPLQRLGAGVNGSTSADRTNYYVDLPVAHLELALAMESDRMGYLLPALTDEKLAVQKSVVTNEFRQNYANRPYGMAWAAICAALYSENHPYRWLTIGDMDDVAAATREDVEAFFTRHYVPRNASLALVGDIDEDDALTLAERYFGAIPGGSRPPSPRVEPARLDRSVHLTMRDRVQLDRTYESWHTVSQFHPDDAALAILADILGRGRASRLYRELVEAGIAQNLSVHQSGRELAGTFTVVVTLRPGRSRDEAREVVESELSKIAQGQITTEELERARNGRLAGFLYALDNVGGFGGVADRLNAYNTYLGDPGRIVTDWERYREVDASGVVRVAGTYLHDFPRVALSVLARSTQAVVPIDRTKRPAPRPAVPFRAPVPDVLTLACGSPLWVIRRPDLPIVAATAVVAAGATTQPAERPGLAHLTNLLLDEGTRRHGSRELAAIVEGLGAHLSTSCGFDGAFVAFQGLSPHTEVLLDLAAQVLAEPTFPAPEFERLRGQTLAALQAERDSAEARAQRALLGLLYPPGHPYGVPVDGEARTVASLTAEEAAAFHATHYRPGRTAWVVAGDVDPLRIRDQLDGVLDSWNGSGDGQAATTPLLLAPPRAERVRIVVLDRPGAPQAVVRAGHIGLSRRDPDYHAWRLFNQVVGGQFTSRLNEELRERKGLTYGVRSHTEARVGAGPFWVGASLQADRIGEALTELQSELTAILGDRPPSDRELDDARRSLVEGQARHFESPSALVSAFAGLCLLGLPPDEHRHLPDRLGALTREAILEAATRQLHPDSLTYVVVADAAQVMPQLERLEWATVERMNEESVASLSGG